jgi:hypothetical protein
MSNIIPAITPPQSDDKAIREADAFAQGNLEEAVKLVDRNVDRAVAETPVNPNDAMRSHLGRAALVLFWTVVIGIAAMGITWFWHVITPASVHYVAEGQFAVLQSMLFAGVVASAFPVYVKKFMQ